MRSRILTVLAALVFFAAPSASHAQIVATKGLQFGTIIAGTSNSVLPTAPAAAQFTVSGLIMIATYANLTLPTTLTKVGGTATMPVSFCSTCAIYRVNNSNPVGGTVFNPAIGFTGLGLAINTVVYIWVGGSANPPVGQTPGSYSGSVVFTMGLLL